MEELSCRARFELKRIYCVKLRPGFARYINEVAPAQRPYTLSVWIYLNDQLEEFNIRCVSHRAFPILDQRETVYIFIYHICLAFQCATLAVWLLMMADRQRGLPPMFDGPVLLIHGIWTAMIIMMDQPLTIFRSIFNAIQITARCCSIIKCSFAHCVVFLVAHCSRSLARSPADPYDNAYGYSHTNKHMCAHP